ncbi:unnamed protein product [Laminaria digitata]
MMLLLLLLLLSFWCTLPAVCFDHQNTLYSRHLGTYRSKFRVLGTVDKLVSHGKYSGCTMNASVLSGMYDMTRRAKGCHELRCRCWVVFFIDIATRVSGQSQGSVVYHGIYCATGLTSAV